jgi:hypothetical protein
MKRKRGRPAKGLKCQITLFVTAPTYRFIEKFAAERDISFSEATRQIIKVGIENLEKTNER